jgi:hypothetical protein
MFATIAAGVLCGFATEAVHAQDIDSMPPVVVKTVPESGSKEVPPGEYEIRVRFSKKMTAGSWSWGTAWAGSAPDSLGAPRYEADQMTCVLKVKLEANKTYGWWLNSQKFQNFKDAQGHPAVPYLLVFDTGGMAEAAAPSGDLKKRGTDFVDLLVAGKFADAEKQFAEVMRAAMPEASLAGTWRQLDAGGKFVGHDPARVQSEAGFACVYVPCHWERNQLDIKVVFDGAGKVSGLWALAPKAPAMLPQGGAKQ